MVRERPSCTPRAVVTHATVSTRYRWGDVARQRHWRERLRDLAASIAAAVTTRRSTTPVTRWRPFTTARSATQTACGVILLLVHVTTCVCARSVSIATRPRTGRPGNRGSILYTGQEFLLFPPNSDQLGGSPGLFSNGNREHSRWSKAVGA